jgi:predicted DNA-binding antitoxin AbrB/MazE fold protein
MTTFFAVLQDGALKPHEPLEIPDGQELELAVVRLIPDAREEQESLGRLEETLRRIREEAAKYSDEWWDEFQRDIQANRVNFEERV